MTPMLRRIAERDAFRSEQSRIVEVLARIASDPNRSNAGRILARKAVDRHMEWLWQRVG